MLISQLSLLSVVLKLHVASARGRRIVQLLWWLVEPAVKVGTKWS